MKEIIQRAELGDKRAIRQLYTVWLEKGGKPLCLQCGGEVATLIRTMKTNEYTTSEWQLNFNGQVRLKKGDPRVVSNQNLTEELAIEFLKENPDRIHSFKVYPADWKVRIGLETPTEEIKVKEEIIQSEPIAVPLSTVPLKPVVQVEEEEICEPCWNEKLSKFPKPLLFKIFKPLGVKPVMSITKEAYIDMIISYLVRKHFKTWDEVVRFMFVKYEHLPLKEQKYGLWNRIIKKDQLGQDYEEIEYKI